MTRSVQDILAQLDQYWDRIVRRPMSPAEIDDLEKRVGLSAPAPFRDYLSRVGLFQDLTWGVSSEIEVFDKPAEFAKEREFIADILGPRGRELFPLGHDGAGNIYALGRLPSGACHICFVDHERVSVTIGEPFTAWLEGVVADVLKDIGERVPNDRKAWCVQFSLKGALFADLVQILSSVGEAKEIDAEWRNPDTSPAGVTSTERRLMLDGETFKVTRLEYPGWRAPLLSFDMHEPVTTDAEHSRIRALNALFQARCSGYKLVDYGPLEMTENTGD
jgi:hypothetical protein